MQVYRVAAIRLMWTYNELMKYSNKIEVIVLDDQKSRELRRIRTTGLAVYFVRLYDIVNIHANVDMAK